MSNKLLGLQREIELIMLKFRGNEFLRAEAMLQLIHRENILTGNRLRKKYGEPEIIPEPVMYKPNGFRASKKVEWVIDVPKPWISETGKVNYHE